MAIDVVWFKRDLRTRDHVPLLSAVLSGRPVLCLFILEPERLKQEDTDAIHIDWELDCAVDLSKTLRKSGSDLHIKIGDAIEVLENLDNDYGIKRILSHEETGNSWSYDRDKKILQWCKEKEINWHVYR